MTALRVLIADDHPVVRDGLRAMLASTGAAEVVGEAATGEQAVRETALNHPDVVVMDLAMPGLNGVEATRQILRAAPEVGVLVLTMHDDDDDSVFAAMRAGAHGYVLKGASQQELVAAIQAIARGEAIFGPPVATRVLGFFTGRKPLLTQPFPELTPREREILGLIAQGLNNAAIAQRLHLAPKTVRNLASSVFAKLQVADRAQAMRRALDEGLGQ
jgi:DNA-binding NarL/FixJ family response regulator